MAAPFRHESDLWREKKTEKQGKAELSELHVPESVVTVGDGLIWVL